MCLRTVDFGMKWRPTSRWLPRHEKRGASSISTPATLHATFAFIQRDATLTHLAYAWQALVSGNELQLLNRDGSRTFAFIAMHTDRLYILEGTTPKGYPPPVLFQQSLGFVDVDGNVFRYAEIYSNMNVEHPDSFPAKPARVSFAVTPAQNAPTNGR